MFYGMSDLGRVAKMSQLKKGAILSYVSIFVTMSIAFIYTPFMIRLLGQSEYGLYALIGSVAGYLSILDLGLGNTIVRYNSLNRANGDKVTESKLNGMFLILYSLIGVLTVIVGTIIYFNIENIFSASLTSTEVYKAKIMIIILSINFALSFPLTVFGSIIQAYEKFVVFKALTIVRSLLIPLFTLPFLFLGYGSITMVMITTLVNITVLLFNAIYCFKYLQVKIIFGKVETSFLKEVTGYSFFIFLNVLVNQIYWNTGQFILGVTTSTALVAVFAIGMQIVTLYMMFSTAISNLFLPKLSIMVANNATYEELSDVMIRVGRIQFIILAYILCVFILFGKPFITLWAGTNYQDAYYIVLIIMIPLIIPLIQNVGISILQAMNIHGFRSVVYTAIAFLNIIISTLLAERYGIYGVAFTTAGALILGNIVIMNLYYFYKIRLNIPKFWNNILKLSIPIIVVLIIGSLINLSVPNSIMYLLIKIILFTIIFFKVIFFLALNSYEKKILNTLTLRAKSDIRK
jgi:O-antigen/teichoic acid export membrane protein